MGVNKRLNMMQEDIRVPANTAYAISGEVARQFDPEYWTRKTQTDDLKNAKVFL